MTRALLKLGLSATTLVLMVGCGGAESSDDASPVIAMAQFTWHAECQPSNLLVYGPGSDGWRDGPALRYEGVAVSQDGTAVAAVHRKTDCDATDGSSLAIIQLSNWEVQDLGPSLAPSLIDWSPSGRYLATFGATATVYDVGASEPLLAQVDLKEVQGRQRWQIVWPEQQSVVVLYTDGDAVTGVDMEGSVSQWPLVCTEGQEARATSLVKEVSGAVTIHYGCGPTVTETRWTAVFDPAEGTLAEPRSWTDSLVVSGLSVDAVEQLGPMYPGHLANRQLVISSDRSLSFAVVVYSETVDLRTLQRGTEPLPPDVASAFAIELPDHELLTVSSPFVPASALEPWPLFDVALPE